MEQISKNLERIRLEIPTNVQIVAATKTVPAEVISRLKGIGIFTVGENRVQEMLQKYPSCGTGLSWHFIGQLQSNKVKYIIDKVDLIHSVDRLSLAAEIDRCARRIGKVQDVLVEVNVGGESSKGGVGYFEAERFISELEDFNGLRVVGIMSVLPVNAEDKMYLQMKQLYDKLKVQGKDMRYLSMGMSGDYLVAVRNGANMVRIGTGLFGERVSAAVR